MIHDKFAQLDAAADHGDAFAKDSLALISETIRAAFKSGTKYGIKLNGADPCERVAEALAVWLAESNPANFAAVENRAKAQNKESI